jgi:hypothetical protein
MFKRNAGTVQDEFAVSLDFAASGIGHLFHKGDS